MLGTELAYVKANLARCSKAELKALAKKIGKQPITLERIVNGHTRAPRSDVTGQLAIHFRTQEKRRK
jgi:Mg2+ and Co2+ transporter CorA